MKTEMVVRAQPKLGHIPEELWNSFGMPEPPTSHEFLAALEDTGCLGPGVGWIPMHMIFSENGSQTPAAAMPAYIKSNSFGEFVFDWSWADAHARSGLSYFPKWVVAAPFTPATGRRLLVPKNTPIAMCESMVEGAIRMGEHAGVSSVHWLFCTDQVLLDAEMLIQRMGCQFHWRNAGYRDFQDYLDRLTAKRRKEIKRERRQVAEAGIEIQRVMGHETSAETWTLFHRLYQRTFDKHGNYPALSAAFFKQIGQKMGEKIMLVLAHRHGDLIAAGFFMIGADVLYGRYWGAIEDVPSLHFEVCYYQGLEFCLERGLNSFQPGAQGEHKVSRGFEPTATWSAHWIADPNLRKAISQHVKLERRDMEDYMRALELRLPFRAPPEC